jgi:flavin reductase (DIM6/NTAB) family NADH-FMN oxidoreductase RutF
VSVGTVSEVAPDERPARAGVDPAAFRQALGHFLTGVAIVTTLGPDGEPVGMTVNAFTSVSLDPPLVLVCVARGAASLHAMEMAERYAVHILHHGQHEMSTGFARSATGGARKFAEVPWHPSDEGLPLLDDCLARIECTIVQRLLMGDHVGYLGRVDAAAVGEPTAPLGFFRGKYANLAG